MNEPIPALVCEMFGLRVRTAARVAVGLIHDTYRLATDRGDVILQRLGKDLASDANLLDMWHVTEHLARKNFPASRLIRTTTGELSVVDGDGKRWRLQHALPGVAVDIIASETSAYVAGHMLGCLHVALSDLEYSFLAPKLLHETNTVWNDLVVKMKAGWPMESALERLCDEVAGELYPLLPPAQMTPYSRKVTHGDPKISNFLWSDRGAVVGVIDFDTAHRGAFLDDIGDAMRSWCGAEEDNPHNSFNGELFVSALKGYLETVVLEEVERTHLVAYIEMITLELAARFLIDVFEDRYFGWSKPYPSRRDHNLARAKGQLALFRDLKRKRDSLEAIVHRLTATASPSL